MNSLFDIKGKKILITGGTGVLGLEWSKYLAAQGAYLIVLGRELADAEDTVEQIRSNGNQAIGFGCDVTNEEDLKRIAALVKSQIGSLDVLINAAGGNMAGATIGPEKSVLDSDVDALRKIVDLNYIGTYLSVKSFLPLFLDTKKGSIINISSMSAERP